MSTPAELAAARARQPGRPARLTHRLASEVEIVSPVWLWRSWLVAGAVQLLVGRQGSGKTTFASWVVAQLSTGRPWPGELHDRDPLLCALLSLEETAERQNARLLAAGAERDAVVILGDVEDFDETNNPRSRRWQLPRDCALLEDKIVEQNLSVVVVDGLGYALAGDNHNYGDVGKALSELAGVAERTGATILGLTHPPKGHADATTSAIGSTAWTAVARMTWVMGFDPTDETPNESDRRRVVRPAPGSNYRLPDHGLSFRIAEHDETEAGFVTNLELSDVDAQSITAPPEPDGPEQRSRLDEARDFVRTITAAGPVRAGEATEAAQKGGIDDRTLRRARAIEGVKVRRRGGLGSEGTWWWEPESLNGQDPNNEAVGHLGQTLNEQEFYSAAERIFDLSGHDQITDGSPHEMGRIET